MGTGFLNEDNGNRSSMRLMCLISVILAGVIALITMLKPGADTSSGLYFTGMFLSAGFGGKFAQKWPEANGLSKVSDETEKAP